MTDVIFEHFDKQEIRVLAQAPVLVFLLISAADGVIDKREIKSFASLLTAPPYSVLLSVMARARLSLVDALRQLTENPVDYWEELQHINRVLERGLPSALAQQIKLQLYELGWHVAASSGHSPEEVDNNICRQEGTALKVIAGIFGIDERHRESG
ncbi:MAG: hypothetical protein PVI92_15480 [Chromatiales bacterium]